MTKTYTTKVSVKTKEGYDLILKSKDYYDPSTKTQFSPSIYELYDDKKLIQQEHMDFQVHLYEIEEMETYLSEIGFKNIINYQSFDKTLSTDNNTEMFLYECSK